MSKSSSGERSQISMLVCVTGSSCLKYLDRTFQTSMFLMSSSQSETTPFDQISRMADVNVYEHLYCREVSRRLVGFCCQ